MSMKKSVDTVYEALQQDRRPAKVRKAKRLKDDVEMLRNPPEALKEDIAELCGAKSYERAKQKLERL